MNSIPQNKAGTAFGTIATIRSLAASIGLAVIGSYIHLIQWRSFDASMQLDKHIPPLGTASLERLLSGKVISSDMLLLKKYPVIKSYLEQAQITGFFYSHITIGFLLVLAFACVFVLYHSHKGAHHITNGE